MKFEIRRGTFEDAEDIVNLFSGEENLHRWTLQKWRHYYQNYPEGETVFFVAESEQGIIGHYSLFPLVICGEKVYMGAHAYVKETVRGLAVISQLMKSLDEFCVAHNIPFIVGFANQKFTTVKTKLFKWVTPFYASFVTTTRFDPLVFKERSLRFQYSDEWQQWRFGDIAGPVVSQYRKTGCEMPTYQLLYSQVSVAASDYGLSEFECWKPDGYQRCPDGESFSQPFSLKIYDRHWVGPDLLNPENWFIQMGDSDTFLFEGI
jgi:hypothetical protein